jgi:CubicO group peptidase (beta-lactamase class C family)
VSAVSHSSALSAKKVCKTKKVHGKKKKVCTTTKPRPTPTPTPTLSLAQQVDNYLTSRNFSGSILLEKGGQILLEKGYGLADKASKTPNTPQTKLPVFGVNFFMAAVGILKLQEEGKLSMQDKICSYISACPAAWQPITLEEVLTSTSGIPEYDWPSSTGGPDVTMAGCQAQPLAASPGQQIVGSDCLSLLLNSVIEKVSGKTWSDFMQQTIFDPAGMTNSGRMTSSLQPPQRARGYTRSGPAPELNYNAYYMAYSTLEAIYRFDTALLAGKILSRQSLDVLFTPRMPNGTDLNGDQVYMGYGGTGVFKSSSTEVAQVVPAGGDDTWGFLVTDFFSPDNGTVAIELNNDTGAFSNDDENHFWGPALRATIFAK